MMWSPSLLANFSRALISSVTFISQSSESWAASPAGRALRAHWVGGSFTTVMEKLIPVADDLRRVARAEDPEGRFVQALLAQVEDHGAGSSAAFDVQPQGVTLAGVEETPEVVAAAHWLIVDP